MCKDIQNESLFYFNSFISKKGLHQHLKQHLQKPFKCNLCEKCFPEEKYLKVHEKRFCQAKHEKEIIARQQYQQQQYQQHLYQYNKYG